MIVKEYNKDFQITAKKYVINMLKSSARRTLHKKNGCQHGKYPSVYVDFDSMEEVTKSGIYFQKCKTCFKKEREDK